MKVDLVKKVLVINVYGEEVTINFPTRAQSKEVRKELSAEGVDHDAVFEKYLTGLGMPMELLNKISDEDLRTILEALNPVEKKS